MKGKNEITHDLVNPDFSVRHASQLQLQDFLLGLKNSDRYILGRAITLLESKIPDKRSLAMNLLSRLPVVEGTVRIGITGSPGVGKSTFIDSFGSFLVAQGCRPAVLAIDPSSTKNKGSILGDKTRMLSLASSEKAFVRPSPSSSSLGGTADMTREAISLCEAAGFNYILIETVGVGQSEIEVSRMTDLNIVLLQPGAGDEIQGIKRGIMEVADLFVVNKADGIQLALAERTRQMYGQAAHFFLHELQGWQSPVHLVSSLEKIGLEDIKQSIDSYVRLSSESSYFELKRKIQLKYWFQKHVAQEIQEQAFRQPKIKSTFENLTRTLDDGKISIYSATNQMQKLIQEIFL
jgi:LAO/AO transport system kinase